MAMSIKQAFCSQLTMVNLYLLSCSGIFGKRKINQDCGHTNTFHATDLFLYPLKTSENLWFLLEGEGDPWH